MERENFYILLNLHINPPETNISKIEGAIRKKQAEWSRMRNHPTKGREAQLYLGFIPEIRKVMADEALRKTEAKEAKVILAKNEREKYKALDEAIIILSAKGTISEKEIFALSKKFSIFTESDIRRRIRVPIINDKPKQTKKTLDKTTAEKISQALKIINKSSLYDFLDLAPTSTIKALQDRTKIKNSVIRKSSQKDAFITASGELIGHCLNIFKSEDSKQVYDTTRSRERFHELDEAINIAGLDKNIALEEYDRLVIKGMGLGLSKNDVCEYISEYCKKKRWSVETAKKLSVDNMTQCGICGIMNSLDSINCSNCGYQIKVECPKCREKNLNRASVCNKCGFPIGDMPNAIKLIKDGKLELAKNNINEALSLFLQAEVYWPGHKDIVISIKDLRARKKSIDNLVKEIHNAINNRLLYKARNKLSMLKQLEKLHPELSNERTISQKIKASEAWVEKAKILKNKDQILEAYSKALDLCKDNQEVIEAILKLPPDPPEGLYAKVSIHSISLKWSSTNSLGDISYRVVRKAATRPNNSMDGDILGDTTQTIFDDPNPEPGQLYYYSVFSVRCDVLSKDGPIAGPIMLMAEVEKLNVLPGDNCLIFSWKAPVRADRITVWRKKGGVPLKPGDGEKLSGVNINGFKDSGLENETLYGYLISAVFQDSKGRKSFSKGKTVHSKPTKPSSPIKDLNIRKNGKTLNFSWSPPPKGDTHLFYSNQPYLFSTGEHIDVNRFADLGTQIPVNQIGKAQWKIDLQGVIFFLPVTVNHGIGVIGKPISTTSLDEVLNLQGEINSGKIFLEWNWPAGVQEVLIAYKHDSYPKDPKDKAEGLININIKQYEREGGFVIKRPEKKNYYFIVFTKSGKGDETIYSTGIRCLVPNQDIEEISYEIKLSKGLFRRNKSARLILSSKKKNTMMPKTLLVKKIGYPPIRKTDGSVICTIKNTSFKKKTSISIDIHSGELGTNAYAKLFFADDSQAKIYRLLPKGKERLRLF